MPHSNIGDLTDEALRRLIGEGGSPSRVWTQQQSVSVPRRRLLRHPRASLLQCVTAQAMGTPQGLLQDRNHVTHGMPMAIIHSYFGSSGRL